MRGPGLRGAWCPDGLPAGSPEAGGEALARALLDLEPSACLRRLPGRETFLVDLGGAVPRPLGVEGDALGLELEALQGAGRVVVVKRYRSPERREALRELVAGLAPRSPGRREAENLAGLREAGMPVPRPLLWVPTRAPCAGPSRPVSPAPSSWPSSRT